MGLIEVKRIRVFAHHGCLPEEARIGGHYSVDIAVNADFIKAEESDQLADTIDYSRVVEIVKEQMSIRSALVEHVAKRILSVLRSEWPAADRWRVRVVKERPPVNGDVGCVEYVLEG